MMPLRPDLCACILHGPGSPLLFHRPDLRRGVLRHPIWRRLHGLRHIGLCPRLFRRRPGLKLPEQFFGDWLAVIGLALTGFGQALTGRLNRRSSFVARRRVRCRRRDIRCAGDGLDCWRRRIGFGLKRGFVDPPIRHVRNERNRISDRENGDADRGRGYSQNTGLENSRRNDRQVPTLSDIRLPGFFRLPGEKEGRTIRLETIFCRHLVDVASD